MPRSSHYSIALEAEDLSIWSDRIANGIAKVKLATATPVLIYSGMSGVALATAVSLALWRLHSIEPKMMYVRKLNESSHGFEVERSHSLFKKYDPELGDTVDVPEEERMFIFVDDFISTRTTFNRCVTALKKHTEVHKIRWFALSEKASYLLSESSSFTIGVPDRRG